MLIETDHFISRDIDHVSLRAGTSTYFRFREIIRKEPFHNVCHVPVDGLLPAQEDEKVRKLMEVIEAGYGVLLAQRKASQNAAATA